MKLNKDEIKLLKKHVFYGKLHSLPRHLNGEQISVPSPIQFYIPTGEHKVFEGLVDKVGSIANISSLYPQIEQQYGEELAELAREAVSDVLYKNTSERVRIDFYHDTIQEFDNYFQKAYFAGSGAYVLLSGKKENWSNYMLFMKPVEYNGQLVHWAVEIQYSSSDGASLRVPRILNDGRYEPYKLDSETHGYLSGLAEQIFAPLLSEMQQQFSKIDDTYDKLLSSVKSIIR